MINYFYCFCLIFSFCSSTVAHAQKYEATISTNVGDITVRLFDDTPLHRDNFVTLARQGHYDSLLFHRTIADFMIQAGDPSSRHATAGELLGEDDVPQTIPAEFRPNHRHRKGVLAAARLGDDINPEKASSGSQFYITVAPTTHLDGQYTVFGEVIKGQDVADKISKVSTDRNDRPKKDILITKITINETSN